MHEINTMCIYPTQISLYNNGQVNRDIEYLNIQDEGGTNEIVNKVSLKH